MCEYAKLLQKPFPAEDIEWRVGSTNADKTKGIALAYITNRAIMARLDETFGAFGWKNEYKEWKGTSQLCGISVKHEGEWITKWDGADDSQTEAVKGGLSDAMKRAGYQWGIGRYLYHLENMWVPIKQQGRSYVLVSKPKLPEWALPEGYEQRTAEEEHIIPDEFEGLTPPEPPEVLAQQQNQQQSHNAPIPTDSSKPRASGGMKRVLDLRTKLGMDWKVLTELAATVLERNIKFPLKDYVKTEEEWKKIEDCLLQAS